MASKKQEVAVVEDNAVVEAASEFALPSFLKEGEKRGAESLTLDHIEVAWLKLIQSTTPGVQENNWTPGNFLHSITEREFDTDPDSEDFARFRVVVLQILTPRYMLFNPLDAGGGILARAEDGVHWNPPNHTFKVQVDKKTTVEWTTKPTVKESGLDKWGTFDPEDPTSAPAADLQYRYLCVSPDFSELGAFIIMLQRSALAAGRRLNAFLDNAPCSTFGCMFDLQSQWKDDGPDNKKFVWRFKPAGFVQDQAQYRAYEQMYEKYSDENIVMHDEEKSGVEEVPGTTGQKSSVEGPSEEY